MRTDVGIREFESPSALDTQLVARVSNLLSAAIAQTGSASLVVSGGRTPKGFFHLLSQEDILWPDILVTLADERWVDASHADSNEKLVRENLLINLASKAKFMSLKNSSPTAAQGVERLEYDLASAGSFTVVILGMGDDGHTASLFPGSNSISAGLDMNSGSQCVAVMPLDAPHERMSMTLPRLLNTQEIIIHLCGEDKRNVLSDAFSGKDPYELPIRAILQQEKTPVAVYWSK